jgi:hypothetical protein
MARLTEVGFEVGLTPPLICHFTYRTYGRRCRHLSYPQRLCPISPWQHLPWPKIMVPPFSMSLLQVPGGGFVLATAGSLGWDAQ